MSAER